MHEHCRAEPRLIGTHITRKAATHGQNRLAGGYAEFVFSILAKGDSDQPDSMTTVERIWTMDLIIPSAF